MGVKIVVSIGAPRSGTTWAFNTTKSLFQEQNISHTSLFTNQEEINEAISHINENPPDFLFIKTHKVRTLKVISSFLPGLIFPNLIISVRDPLQTILSQLRIARGKNALKSYTRVNKKLTNMYKYICRFDETIEDLSRKSSIVLINESEIKDPGKCNEKIQQISNLLFGTDISDIKIDSIRNANSLEQVQNFIDKNFSPEEKLSFDKYDKSTHYHANHIKTEDYFINKELLDQESLEKVEKANDDFISKYKDKFCNYLPTEVSPQVAVEILREIESTIITN